jgi:tetratricopeptide (TPR) repeat protein
VIVPSSLDGRPLNSDRPENSQGSIPSRTETALTSAGVNEDIEILKEAVRFNPSCRAAAIRLTDALKAKGDSGVEFWIVMAQNNPNQSLPAEMLIDAFSTDHDGATFRPARTAISRLHDVAMTINRICRAKMTNKDDKQRAVEAWKGAVKMNPECYEYAIQLTETFVINEQTKSAIQFWSDALSEVSEVAQKPVPYEIAILQLAKCHLESGDLDSFAHRFTAVLASSVTSHYYLSRPRTFMMDPLERLWTNESQIQKIFEPFENVEWNVNINTFTTNVITESAYRGNFDVAIALGKARFENFRPRNDLRPKEKCEVAREVTNMYNAKGELHSALEYWKSALSKYPEDLVVMIEYIRVMIDTGDFAGAIDMAKSLALIGSRYW